MEIQGWPPIVDTTLIFLTFLLNAVTSVCCTALGMLIIWQNGKRSSNQLVMLAFFSFAAYNVVDLLSEFNYVLHLPLALQFYLLVTFYALSVLFLFMAGARFVRMKSSWLYPFSLVGIGYSLLLIILTWTGILAMNIVEEPNHTVGFQLTPLGGLVLLADLLYQVAAIVLIRGVQNERSRALWPILLLMPLEGSLNAISSLDAWPHQAVVLLIVALLFARLVMREHVFKPLHELNEQLIYANLRLEQANRFKSQFLANMSHELRTPLNAVIGYADLIATGVFGPLTEEQSDRLTKIGRSGRTLLELINDALDLGKIEAGRLELVREPTSLTELVQSAVLSIRDEAEAKRLNIKVELPDNLPPVLADSQRLEQILRNLLSNAVKATDTGEIGIGANAEAGEVTLFVRDTGSGIPLAEQPYIFDLYRLTDRQSGTGTHGLALAITRHLVQMHGGQLRFTSSGIPGKGTTFYLTLPTNEVKAPTETKPQAAELPLPAPVSG